MNINENSTSIKVELKNLTKKQKERFDEIFNNYVDAHNLILENIIDAGISYTQKEARRALKENSKNTTSDNNLTPYLFSDLQKKIKKGESVVKKKYGGDHSYRTSVRCTKFEYGELSIPHFIKGEAIVLEKGINISEGFTSVKISRESNKYYVIFGYEGSEEYETHMREKKCVYIISNKSFKGYYKVGITIDAQSRLNGYQTSDPHRAYKIEYILLTYKKKAEIIEKIIHKIFKSNYEWIKDDLQDIIKEIKILDKEVSENKETQDKKGVSEKVRTGNEKEYAEKVRTKKVRDEWNKKYNKRKEEFDKKKKEYREKGIVKEYLAKKNQQGNFFKEVTDTEVVSNSTKEVLKKLTKDATKFPVPNNEYSLFNNLYL